MEEVFLLKGLDCPHCSGEIERKVRKISGIESVNINLIKQTLTVKTSLDSPETESVIVKTVKGVESGIEVVRMSGDPGAASLRPAKAFSKEEIRLMARLFLGAVFMAGGLIFSGIRIWNIPAALLLCGAAYIILGFDIVIKAAENIVKGKIFDENFLMSLSTIGAFIIGEYPEAAAVMLFYQIGEFFQERAVDHSRRSIAGLMDLKSDSAVVYRNGEWVETVPKEVAAGEVIMVKPGEKVPLDGVVEQGNSTVDTKALTGEPVPKTISRGDTVLAGYINQSGAVTVKVTKTYEKSTAAQIIELVETASQKKAPTENFITAFARYYTPAVVACVALLWTIPPLIFGGDWGDWLYRGMIFLVVSCPCALVISVPLAFFGGIGAASKKGILIKGGNYLEALDKTGTVVFDKTGTLTQGVFEVTDIIPADGFSEEDLLALCAGAESMSNHPIAKSIARRFPEPKIGDVKQYTEIPGKGIKAVVDGREVLAGSGELLESEGIEYTVCNEPGTKVYTAVQGVFAGCVVISDKVKPDSAAAVSELKRMGITKTVMITGDDTEVARRTADELDIDECYARLLPNQKAERIEILRNHKEKNKLIAFVGDGINDAPVLAGADVGIAMGGTGTDAAIEAADVVIMTDEPSKVVQAIKIARFTKRIVIQNIVISLGVKGIFLVLGALGMASMWEAVFGDVGVALIAVLNSIRIINSEKL